MQRRISQQPTEAALESPTKAFFPRPAAAHILRKAFLEPSCLPEPMKITAESLATLHLLAGLEEPGVQALSTRYQRMWQLGKL